MAILRRRFTTWGAVASILVGAVSALVLIYISPRAKAEERFYEAEPRIHVGVTPKAVPAEAPVAYRGPRG